MSSSFRLHPEPDAHKDVVFRLGRSAYQTIKAGGFGCLLLVPHLLLPVYGIYVLLNRYIKWVSLAEDYVGIAVALTEGLSFGAVIGLAILRYGTTGKIVKGRRIEKTATEGETKKQERIEVALRAAVYIFTASLIWEYLNQSKFSPNDSDYARRTSSGLMTASSHIRKIFNNESVLPNTEEARKQMAGVGLNYDIRNRVKNAPRLQIPGFYIKEQKSAFLRAWEWIWAKVTSGPRVGAFEIGPRNW